MASTATVLPDTYAFKAITAVDGSGLLLLSASNIATGTLGVARGGTGQSTFGGTNRLLFTTAADTLSSITTANSSVLATNGSGLPAWATTLPAVNGSALTNLSAANISAGTLAVGRGGTGVTTFGGTNRLLYTSAADTLTSLVVANSSVLVTSGLGAISWSTTLPAVNGSALTNLTAANVTGSNALPDGVLSTNVPLKSASSNTFAGDMILNSSGSSTTTPRAFSMTTFNPGEAGRFNFGIDAGFQGGYGVNMQLYGYHGCDVLCGSQSLSPPSYTTGTNNTYALSVGGPFKLKSYTVATLPTAGTAARMAYASNGRKNGEGAGAGTGVPAFDDGTAWRACDTGASVAA